MLAGGPKTVTAACAVMPAEVATTAHGWLDELVAVAAKRPLVVIAPQPPVTVQAAAMDDVNCRDCPTETAALTGAIVRGRTGSGVAFCWK